jgi:hypothetical protein
MSFGHTHAHLNHLKARAHSKQKHPRHQPSSPVIHHDGVTISQHTLNVLEYISLRSGAFDVRVTSAVWQPLVSALDPGGIFAGHLFGDRDTWSGRTEMTILSRREVARLLEGWKVIELRESEWDGTTALGEPKHWHLFEIVARRPDPEPRPLEDC